MRCDEDIFQLNQNGLSWASSTMPSIPPAVHQFFRYLCDTSSSLFCEGFFFPLLYFYSVFICFGCSFVFVYLYVCIGMVFLPNCVFEIILIFKCNEICYITIFTTTNPIVWSLFIVIWNLLHLGVIQCTQADGPHSVRLPWIAHKVHETLQIRGNI